MRILGRDVNVNVQLQQKILQDSSCMLSRISIMTKLVSLAEMLFENRKKTYCPTYFKCKWRLTDGELSGCLVDIDFVDDVMKITLRSKSAAQCRFIIANLEQWRNELWYTSKRIELDYMHV